MQEGESTTTITPKHQGLSLPSLPPSDPGGPITGGTATAPGTTYAGTAASNLFDGDTTNEWDGCCDGYPNQDLHYALAAPASLGSYSIVTTDAECPVAWELQSLRADSSWVTIGLYPIVTLEKQLPNMIGNLV